MLKSSKLILKNDITLANNYAIIRAVSDVVSDSNAEVISSFDKLESKIAEVAQGVKESKFKNNERKKRQLNSYDV